MQKHLLLYVKMYIITILNTYFNYVKGLLSYEKGQFLHAKNTYLLQYTKHQL